MNNKNNNSTLKYPVVRNLPVARFYYEGNHTHPVRRTVIVTESTPRIIKGYEIREGSETRSLSKAPIKAYTKSKIAAIGQCGRRLRNRTEKKNLANSTLTRDGLLSILMTGF